MLFTSAGLAEGKQDVYDVWVHASSFWTTFADLCIVFVIISKSTTPPTWFCRKSWLVPTQYLLGLFMLCLSTTVNSLLQSEGGPKILTLTAVFFMLSFLAATQVGNNKHSPQRDKYIRRQFFFISINIYSFSACH